MGFLVDFHCRTQMVTDFGSSLTSVKGKLQTLDDNVFGTRAAEVTPDRTKTITNLATTIVEWNIINEWKATH